MYLFSPLHFCTLSKTIITMPDQLTAPYERYLGSLKGGISKLQKGKKKKKWFSKLFFNQSGKWVWVLAFPPEGNCLQS